MPSNNSPRTDIHPIDEQEVRLTAYFLWEQDGHPDGRAQEYWYRAWAQHRRMAGYDEALREGWTTVPEREGADEGGAQKPVS